MRTYMEPLAAESLLAAVDIRRALEPGPLRVTAAQLATAQALPARIAREVRAFVAGDTWERPRALPDGFDYAWLRERLASPPSHAELADKLAALDDPEDALAFAEALGRAWQYLIATCPQRSRTTAVGPRQVPPDGQALGRFRERWHVVQDPLHAIASMREGTLTRGEVDALEAVYPSLYEAARAAVVPALVQQVARKASWELPYRRDKVLQTFLRTSSVDPRLAREMQAAFATGSAKVAHPSGGGALKAGGEAMQTPTQRVEAR